MTRHPFQPGPIALAFACGFALVSAFVSARDARPAPGHATRPRAWTDPVRQAPPRDPASAAGPAVKVWPAALPG